MPLLVAYCINLIIFRSYFDRSSTPLARSITFPSMQIFVKFPDGIKTITLDMEPQDTVMDVKLQIKKKKSILPRDQRLIFASQDLEDHRMLSDYSIRNDFSLQLLPRAG
jgi:hypothetical protein